MLSLFANILAQCPGGKGYGKNQNEGGEQESDNGPEEGDDANDDAPSLQGEAEEKPVNCRQRWAHDDVLEGGTSNSVKS